VIFFKHKSLSSCNMGPQNKKQSGISALFFIEYFFKKLYNVYMKENMGFENVVGASLEQKGFVGNDDSLKEDRYVASVIGKNIEKLEEMNKEAVEIQNFQDGYLSDLDQDLEIKKDLIEDDSNLLQSLSYLKSKLSNLKDKIQNMPNDLDLYENNTDILIKSQDLTKEYNSTMQQIQRMEDDIKNYNITEENLSKLKEEYQSLKERYEILEKAWFPENPLNN
jgi:predicted nuclease with TOPRIM domain